MANQITNAIELKDVLDAIYNNRDQYDTYQNLTLYYNDISRTATIFTVDDEETEGTKNIIAVFNPENIVTNDNAFFVTLMKSATVNVSTEETSVYDFALGGYVNVDTLLKNICVALGVSLSGTFADANPTLYSDMINIIRNEYGQALENNAPYIMKKFVNVTTQEETYKSLVPLMCIVRIAIYLNSLGIFVTSDLEPFQPLIATGLYLSREYSRTGYKYLVDNDLITVPLLSDLGLSLMSKNEFATKAREYFSLYTQTTIDVISKFLDLYENDIDWSNDLIRLSISSTHATATDTEVLSAMIIPYNKSFITSAGGVYGDLVNDRGYSSPANGSLGSSGNDGIFYYASEETYRIVFNVTVTKDNTTQEETVTNSKNTYVLDKGITYASEGGEYHFFNIKINKAFVPYCYYNNNTQRYYFYYDSSHEQNLAVGNVYLANGVTHNMSDIHTITNPNYLVTVLEQNTIRENNLPEITLGENDYFFKVGYSDATLGRHRHCIFIIRGINTISFNNRALGQSKSFLSTLAYRNADPNKPLHTSVNYYLEQWYKTFKFTLDSNKVVDIYKVDNIVLENGGIYTLGTASHEQITTINNEFSFEQLGIISGNYIYERAWNNLGDIIDLGAESTIEGLELISGATYPQGVSDEISFNTVYPNWFKTQSNNPQIVNGVLAPTVTSTQWGAVAINQTTPTSQSDAEGGEIDFDNEEQIDNIIDDVDNATEQEDTGTGDIGEGEGDGGDDEGTTGDIPSDSALPQILGSRVYALNGGNMNLFSEVLMEPTFWQNILNGDPLKFLISIQATQSYDGSGTYEWVRLGDRDMYTADTSTPVMGYALSGTDLYVNYDFGHIYIEPKTYNYLDITNTTLSLYLPYIGYVDLDIADFYNRMLVLKAKVNLATGDLIYYVGQHKLGDAENIKYVAQYTGNCQQELPVSSDGAIWNSLKNTFVPNLGKQ